MSTAATELKNIGHFIGGQVVPSASGRQGVVWNPATGEAQAHVGLASVEEVDAVVASAKAAWPAWRDTPISKRAEILFRLRELVDQNRRRIPVRLVRSAEQLEL